MTNSLEKSRQISEMMDRIEKRQDTILQHQKINAWLASSILFMTLSVLIGLIIIYMTTH